MNGYAIFNIDVQNIEAYKKYVEKVSLIVKKFEGEYDNKLVLHLDVAP